MRRGGAKGWGSQERSLLPQGIYAFAHFAPIVREEVGQGLR